MIERDLRTAQRGEREPMRNLHLVGSESNLHRGEV